MNSSPPLSRRQFLRQAACAAVGTTGIVSTVWNLRAINAAAAHLDTVTPGDFKALVCVFLYGGNDSSNMLVPRDATNYALYAQSRGVLALPLASILPITPATSDGHQYGLHPSMPELQSLFAQNKAALVRNVGSLAAPVSRSTYLNGSAQLPPQLFSHEDQQVQWQTSWPDSPQRTGWGGRMADLLHTLNGSSQISMSISIAGTNVLEVGNSVAQYQVSPGGSIGLDRFSGTSDPKYVAYNNIVNLPYTNLFEKAFGATTRRAIDNNVLLSSALAGAAPLTTQFPANSYLGSQLRMVARLIGISNELGMKRQIFFVAAGGFDTHAEQAASQPALLGDLSASLKSFYDATTELGIASKVTAFTASDFGRTFTSNGQGSDHGWGAHHIVMGGAVRGGDLYGRYPVLSVDGPDDTGYGRWIPATAVDQYSATLAKWFGVAPYTGSSSDMGTVFPNLGRFATPDMGFMT